MKKITAFILAVIMIFSVSGCTDSNDFSEKSSADKNDSSEVTFKVLEATEGEGPGVEADNLFDNNADTKWCVTDFDGAEVIFEASEEIKINGYSFVTGNNCETFKGRNPRAWVLSGSDDSKDWDIITMEVKNFDLPDENGVQRDFELTDVEDEYKYFKLEIVDIQSGDCMQIAEFFLSYEGMKKTEKLSEDKEEQPHEHEENDESDYSETTKTKNNISSTSSGPKDHGTYYVSDGATYTLNVGDTITLKCKDAEGGSDCDIRWTVNSYLFSARGAYDNSEECTLKATNPGSGAVNLVVNVGEVGNKEIKQYKVNFTVKGETTTKAASGGSSGGSYAGSYGGSYDSDYCGSCGNTGRLDCGACVGGFITTTFMGVTETRPCGVSSCVGGTRDCPYC